MPLDTNGIPEEYIEDSTEANMDVRQVRIPHHGGDHNGWFTFVRGAVLSRREAWRILLFGPKRGRIELAQSEDSNYWVAE